jgi:hypothetical protein
MFEQRLRAFAEQPRRALARRRARRLARHGRRRGGAQAAQRVAQAARRQRARRLAEARRALPLQLLQHARQLRLLARRQCAGAVCGSARRALQQRSHGFRVARHGQRLHGRGELLGRDAARQRKHAAGAPVRATRQERVCRVVVDARDSEA